MVKLNYYRRWEYFQPKYCDKNVVPYHATILLVWGAHINLQWITFSYWSYYLIKYAMKLEPNDLLNLDIKNTKRLGFDKLSVIQLPLISTTIFAKLVTSIEATITCLGIPIIQKMKLWYILIQNHLNFEQKLFHGQIFGVYT